MIMTDCLLVRQKNRQTGQVETLEYPGVLCTVTDRIEAEKEGFRGNEEIIVRIPGEDDINIFTGDEISQKGKSAWFTVTEVKDNRKPAGSLSHFKVIGRR